MLHRSSPGRYVLDGVKSASPGARWPPPSPRWGGLARGSRAATGTAADDPLLVQRAGELEIAVRGAEVLLRGAAETIDAAERGPSGDGTARASIATAAARAAAGRAAPEASDHLGKGDRYTRCAEFLPVVRRLWAGQTVTYRGAHSDVASARLRPFRTRPRRCTSAAPPPGPHARASRTRPRRRVPGATCALRTCPNCGPASAWSAAARARRRLAATLTAATRGRSPFACALGARTAGLYVARRSQDTIDTYRPVFEVRQGLFRRNGVVSVFHSVEDAVDRSPALIGSPEQVIYKVHRYREWLGHEVMHIQADPGGLPERLHRESLDLLRGIVLPVLRKEIPSRPFSPRPRSREFSTIDALHPGRVGLGLGRPGQRRTEPTLRRAEAGDQSRGWAAHPGVVRLRQARRDVPGACTAGCPASTAGRRGWICVTGPPLRDVMTADVHYVGVGCEFHGVDDLLLRSGLGRATLARRQACAVSLPRNVR